MTIENLSLANDLADKINDVEKSLEQIAYFQEYWSANPALQPYTQITLSIGDREFVIGLDETLTKIELMGLRAGLSEQKRQLEQELENL